LNPTYQFGKDKFTLPVAALNVRAEQTPGNLNTKKHMLAKGLSQVVWRLVANGTMWLDRYFLSISMSYPLPLSSLRYVDGKDEFFVSPSSSTEAKNTWSFISAPPYLLS